MTRRRRGRAAGAVLALALLVAGCGGQASERSAGTPVPPPAPRGAGTVGAAATTTPAAELRAGLTWLAVERVHLLAHARRVLLQTGGSRTAPPVRATEQRLDEGAQELARTIGGSSSELLGALQTEVDAVLAPAVQVDDLRAAHRAVAARLALRAPSLASDALVRQLDRATASLGGPVPAADPRAAAVGAGILANALAAERMLGSTETSAVVLRSDLTALLVSRSMLAGDPAQTGALDDLSVRLADRVAPGLPSGPVLAALRAADNALLAAASARTSGDRPRAERARDALAAADRDLAARVAQAVPALPPDLVLRELDPGRGPLLAAVGARAGADADAASLSRDTSARSVVTAAVLAAGLADERRLR